MSALPIEQARASRSQFPARRVPFSLLSFPFFSSCLFFLSSFLSFDSCIEDDLPSANGMTPLLAAVWCLPGHPAFFGITMAEDVPFPSVIRMAGAKP